MRKWNRALSAPYNREVTIERCGTEETTLINYNWSHTLSIGSEEAGEDPFCFLFLWSDSLLLSTVYSTVQESSSFR